MWGLGTTQIVILRTFRPIILQTNLQTDIWHNSAFSALIIWHHDILGKLCWQNNTLAKTILWQNDILAK